MPTGELTICTDILSNNHLLITFIYLVPLSMTKLTLYQRTHWEDNLELITKHHRQLHAKIVSISDILSVIVGTEILHV